LCPEAQSLQVVQQDLSVPSSMYKEKAITGNKKPMLTSNKSVTKMLKAFHDTTLMSEHKSF
jgi:hypothetical protein